MAQELENIGARIKHIRQKRRLSQAELAELLKVSVTHVSDIERGRTNCSLSIFKGISESLNVSADWLLQLDTPTTLTYYKDDLSELLAGCSPVECEIILSTLRHLKTSLKLLENDDS